jgi:hypothetical protein
VSPHVLMFGKSLAEFSAQYRQMRSRSDTGQKFRFDPPPATSGLPRKSEHFPFASSRDVIGPALRSLRQKGGRHIKCECVQLHRQ